MTTLYPIAKGGREAMENGKHIMLKRPGYPNATGDLVIGFEEHVDDSFTVCDWKVDDGWQR